MNPIAVSHELKTRVRGDVLFDDADRALYGAAACMFETRPLGAVAPRDAEDVRAVVRYGREKGIPLTARGGGTGLAGQTVGEGIVLVFTRHMRAIRRIDPAALRVEVEPGVVLADLNRALAPLGLWFPPDPSSGDACTLGGMIANNAAGVHTLKYGATKDWIESLEVVLDTGEAAVIGPPGSTDPACRRAREIADATEALLSPRRERLRQLRPRVTKNSCGYNVFDAAETSPPDLRKLLAGSEGTLAVVTAATLRLARRPAHRVTVRILLDALDKIGPAVRAVRAFDPSGCELIDRTVIDLVRGGDAALAMEVPAATRSALLVEYDGGDAEAVAAVAARAVDAVRRGGLALDARVAVTEAERKQLWALRKKSSPLLERIPGPRRSTRLIEDGVVPPDRLADYIAGLEKLFDRHGVRGFVFGHAGDAHIHCNLLLDRNDPADRARMRRIAEETTDLLRELGGTLSGEHGDGVLRAEFIERLYGPELAGLFREIKRAWDPTGILNPGRKVPKEGVSFLDLIPARPGPVQGVLSSGFGVGGSEAEADD
jgi:FAD/FMN-containing dehydrogenase